MHLSPVQTGLFFFLLFKQIQASVHAARQGTAVLQEETGNSLGAAQRSEDKQSNHHEALTSLFGWAYSLVNNRKFSIKIVFFSHTKPASSTSSRSNDEQIQ